MKSECVSVFTWVRAKECECVCVCYLEVVGGEGGECLWGDVQAGWAGQREVAV